MGLTGDFRGLNDLKRRLQRLVGEGFSEELADVLGSTALKQVDDGFRNSRNPYGEAWKPLALRQGKPMLDTGSMAASANYQPTRNGFRINIPKKQAMLLHHGGVVRPVSAPALRFKVRGGGWYTLKRVVIPSRLMVPVRSRGLGSIWGHAFDRAAAAFLRRTLGR